MTLRCAAIAGLARDLQFVIRCGEGANGGLAVLQGDMEVRVGPNILNGIELDRDVVARPDKADIRGGDFWHTTIGEQIGTTNAAAVFVGQHGVGPWQIREIIASLKESHGGQALH